MAKVPDSLFIDSMTLAGEVSLSELDERGLRERIAEMDARISALNEHLVSLIAQRDRLSSQLKQTADDIRLSAVECDREPVDFPDVMSKAGFMIDLFSPRMDVYATRGRSKSPKGVGYYPVCSNRWDECCPILQGRESGAFCKTCEHRLRPRLTADEIVRRNLSNHDEQCLGAIGIYPLKDGNVTRFVAIDLDSASWQSDARLLVKTAREMGIAMLWERSCSGKGAHLWTFFCEDVPASLARRLAAAVIDKTRENHPSISLDSYDRMFPSQDSLTKGGIGNLILLPLVASAAMRGCTVFMDDDGSPIPLGEQLTYLSTVHRHSKAEVEAILRIHDSGYSDSISSMPSDEEMNPGWIRRIPRLERKDFSDRMVLYLSSGVGLDKNVLSSKAQEAFRRMATISNPEYYKTLVRNDGHAGDIASRIPLYEENERVLKLPRGLLHALETVLKTVGVDYVVEDHRVSTGDFLARGRKDLWPRQKEALEKILESDIGILAGATGFGKTYVALSTAMKRKERTLVIVPSRNLLDQWAEKIRQLMEIETVSTMKTEKGRSRKVPGMLGGGHDRLSGVLDIVTLQTLSARIESGDFDFALAYGFVIVDECHHIAAQKSRFVLEHLAPKHVLGLSATVKRADGLERIVYSQCGPVVYCVSAAQLAYERGMMQRYVPRFLETTISCDRRSTSFASMMDGISCNEDRSAIIADDIASAYRDGHRILVFTRRLEQNSSIAEALERTGIPCVALDGAMSRKEARAVLDGIRKADRPDVLIATDKLLGEGVDLPSLDTLFLASPFKQERIVQQCAGRLSRISQGKTSVTIYDYVDYRIPALSRMFASRQRIYRKLGFLPSGDEHAPQVKILYCEKDFLEVLLADIASAARSVFVFFSFILPSSTTRRILEAVKARGEDDGIRIGIQGGLQKMDGKLKNAVDEMLSRLDLPWSSSERQMNCIIIDGRISWYGEIQPLGMSRKSEEAGTIMRIVDENTAMELADVQIPLLQH